MSRDTFDAISWLQKENFSLNNFSSLIKEEIPSFLPPSSNSFSQNLPKEISNFFKEDKVDFSEGSLTSNTLVYNEILALLFKLQQDVSAQFDFNLLSRAIKIAIHEEFITNLKQEKQNAFDYEHSSHMAEVEWENFHFFSSALSKSIHLDSKNTQIINHFISVFFFRVSVAYFFKVRLMVELAKSGVLGRPINIKDLVSPNNFFAQIFRKGGKTELQSECLQSNQYSWYYPTQKLLPDLQPFLDNHDKIVFKDFLSLILSKIFYSNQTEYLSSSDLLKSNPFGELLFSLTIALPKWLLESEESVKNTNVHSSPLEHFFVNDYKNDALNISRYKFTGDHLLALQTCFWNSFYQTEDSSNQNAYKPRQEKELSLINPSFYEGFQCNDFFTNIITELHLITCLAHLAKKTQIPSTELICRVINYKKEKEAPLWGTQINLFPELNNKDQIVPYDRIILNLNSFPKNNPHPFLVGKILSQEEFLSDKGFLFVLSSKKLFIPSLKEKTDQLLQKFKLEASLSFDKLKGGEDIPSFMYIFSKKKQGHSFIENLRLGKYDDDALKKSPCLSFRFSGELHQANDLQVFVLALNNFLITKKADITPMYQAELSSHLMFEFYHDAILDGRLVNSSNKDSSQITHPSFFKHLVRSCLPLDQFFYIESVRNASNPLQPQTALSTSGPMNTMPLPGSANTPFHSHFIQEGLFASGYSDHHANNWNQDQQEDPISEIFNYENNYSYILCLDTKHIEHPLISIISVEIFKSQYKNKKNDLIYFFGLIPKYPNLNINHFKTFFNSIIGRQIIQISLSGSTTKLKGKISAILVPKFLASPAQLPKNLLDQLLFFVQNKEQFLSQTAESVKSIYQEKRSLLTDVMNNYPWNMLTILNYFGETIHNINAEFSTANTNTPQSEGGNIDFSHNFIVNELLKAERFRIHPYNKDYYIEALVASQMDWKQPLKKCLITKGNLSLKNSLLPENDISVLELHGLHKPLVKIYSSIEALQFLKFLMDNALDYPIVDILQGLHVPSSAKLTEIVTNFSSIKNIYPQIASDIEDLTHKLFKDQIVL